MNPTPRCMTAVSYGATKLFWINNYANYWFILVHNFLCQQIPTVLNLSHKLHGVSHSCFMCSYWRIKCEWRRMGDRRCSSSFLSCKANAGVKLAKTGHGPHSSPLVVICVVLLLFVLFHVLFVCKYVLCYCHRVTTKLLLTNICKFLTSALNGYEWSGSCLGYIIAGKEPAVPVE
jgi:hypothetical protein